MSRPIHVIFNSETGITEEREFTDEEMLEYEKAEKEVENRKKEAAKVDKLKASALAKLVALGLTEEEIAAL